MIVLTTEDRSSTVTLLDDNGSIIRHVPRIEQLSDLEFFQNSRTEFRPFGITPYGDDYLIASHRKICRLDKFFNYVETVNVESFFNTHTLKVEGSSLFITHTSTDCLGIVDLATLTQKYYSLRELSYVERPHEDDTLHVNAYCGGYVLSHGKGIVNIYTGAQIDVPGDWPHDLVVQSNTIYCQSSEGIFGFSLDLKELKIYINHTNREYPLTRGLCGDGTNLYVFTFESRGKAIQRQLLQVYRGSMLTKVVPLSLQGGIVHAMYKHEDN